MNRELFEECVAIIKTAWTHDTFSFKGKYGARHDGGVTTGRRGLPSRRCRTASKARF